MTTDADVIIAGAGPAGSLAAYELAIRGIPVLILEKSAFPRYKVCGAGLTHKILREIPFDVSPVLETAVHSIIFSRGFSEHFSRESQDALLYCTNRDKFDNFLLKQALDAGARILHGEQVTAVTQVNEIVKVTTRTSAFHSKLVIGADGASSAVARTAGLRRHIMQGLAWEAEVKADPAIIKAFSKTVFLDWGTIPGGYGWVFPKESHFSIGVGGPASLSKWMMPYYRELLAYLELKHGISILETISLKSWPIPVRVKKSPFHNGRVLVAGDAGGLSDPLTGEGIYYAVRSGRLAGQACHAMLSGNSSTLYSYSKAVNDELMPELLEANRIKYVFNTWPRKIHYFVRDSNRGWGAFGKILRGERNYADIPGNFGGRRLLWGTATRLAKMISNRKETNFSRNGFK
jgi:geranylgeranyl reductase family protein